MREVPPQRLPASGLRGWTGRLPALAPETLLLLVAAFVVTADNLAFWSALVATCGDALGSRLPFLAAVLAATVLGFSAVLGLVTPRPLLKPVLCLVLVASALAGHFMDAYGVLLDRAMLQNALETDVPEVAELMTPRLLGHVAAFGLLPALAVTGTRIRRRPLRRAVAARAAAVGMGLLVLTGSVGAFYRDYVFVARQHRELRHLLNPVNVVFAGIGVLRRAHRDPSLPVEPVGVDARLTPAGRTRARPAVLILVVGETARAASFSIQGYARETNPELSARAVLAFTHVQACGTSTAVSVPCMFSRLGSRTGDADPSRQENLLDVLLHGGVEVLWRDNNSGCKGVCARVPTQRMDASGSGDRCVGNECFDEILLDGLQERLDALHGNGVIVLHQKGSHGPAYHQRYPPEFERFTPACASNDVQGCSREELVNAYDNTILYTDHFLAATIDLLARNSQRFDTALVYVSDHGESLGENGLYLHGLPRVVAPAEQTHVPLVIWLSPGMLQHTGIDTACLAHERAAPLSHDNLFSSVLGLLDIATTAYDPRFDIFADCRPGSSKGGGSPATNG